MKKLIVSMAIMLLCLCIFIGCNEKTQVEEGSESDSNTESTTETAEPEKEFNAILRFTVASDVHIDLSDTATEEARLAELFVQVYDYAATGTNGYSKLDAVVFVGDVSNTGTPKTLMKFKNICDAGIKEGTTPIYMPGNHEFMTQGNKTLENFEKYVGAKKQDHLVINGVHFIYISSTNALSGYSYDSETVKWLDGELVKAAQDNPDMPIFVFQHVPCKNTVSGSDYAGQSSISNVLMKYPQVIDFSGHTHYPITYPKSIHQKFFTSVATGTLSYFAMNINEVYGDLVFPADDEGAYMDQRAYRDGNSYWMVEVDSEGNTMLYGYDIDTKELACTYSVPFTANRSNFIYTDGRWNKPKKPAFPSDAKAEAYNVGVSGFEIRFSQAKCDDVVEYYCAEVYKDGKKVNTGYVLSCYYYTPTPETLSYCCDRLESGCEYEVKITPVTFLGEKGTEPLTVKVKTNTPSSITDADIFDLQYNEDGTPYNAATGEHLKVYGNPIVSENSALGIKTSKFDGESAYMLYDFNDYYNDIYKSFTFELSLKADELGKSMNPCANCEGGGIGYGVEKDGTLKIWICLSGKYRILELGKVNTEDFCHAVTTYDGSHIVCYLNGKETARDDDVHGALSRTGNITSENLVIGGDAADKNVFECPFKGEVGVARVFSSVYTASQVSELYHASMNK